MKRALPCFLFVLFTYTTWSQKQPPVSPCSSNPVYRQFDFWIGEWEAFGTNGVKRGDSKVEKILDSCVILENWTATQVNYKGKSYNTFNAITGKWQQYWVDNAGGVTEYFDGHFENGRMTVQTANVKQPDGTFKIARMIFTKLGEDKVRQLGESSVDEGKTWQVNFDLEYRRKK